MTAPAALFRRLWALLVCLRRHRWTVYLEEHRKGYALSVECDDCERVVVDAWLSRKSW